jgi:dipeptidase D
MRAFENLIPQPLWFYFEEICQIPRPSKKEEQIIKYILDFAAKNGLESKKDKVGNVLIKKRASKGFENKPTLVLQSHLDMVCEKNEGTKFDFEKDPIRPFVENGWVKASGTTLGADDGIGVAAQLAILASKDIPHGPLECLFTVDEETGLTGAFALETGFFEGKTLLNLDSEDEGILFIGCAGGMDTEAILKVSTNNINNNLAIFRIEVAGLNGGHSGDDINKGYGNSIKIISRILENIIKHCKLYLINIAGGNLRNAIPREAFCEIALDLKDIKKIEEIFYKISNDVKSEYQKAEKNLKISIYKKEHDPNTKLLDEKSTIEIINILNSLPNGVEKMSHEIIGLVETSTNLASIKRIDENTFEIGTSQRSSSDTLKIDIANKVASVFRLGGASIRQSTGYPGWKPNPESSILKIANNSYEGLFHTKPVITAIHAGLECGLFLEKFPGLDMISFGPTIRGAHSPDEKLEIGSAEKFWNLLSDILIKA